MQKIELRNNLNAVIESLKSKDVINSLNEGQIDKNSFLKLLIESKAGYDQAQTDTQKQKVFNQFDTSSVYSTENFSNLFSFVSRTQNNERPTYLANNTISNFYSYHKTLLATSNLINNLLFEATDIFEDGNLDIEKNQNKGNLILQVIDDEKVDLKTFHEIVGSIKELLDTIYMLYDKIEHIQFDDYPKIELIDSGSDINFVLKLPEKAANLTAQVFKQFWNLIANNKSYRYRQKLKDVEKSITVLEKINEAKNNNVIDAETAEVLKRGIIENTEKIIFKNTLTKQIVLESREFSNRQLLLEKTKTYLLEEGNDAKEKTE